MNENQNEYVDINAHDNYPDSEQTIEIPTMKVIPLKKICLTIGELPTSYLETMTYYEMLIWFIEYLKNNIIPTVNNNAEAIQEVQSVVLALQNYINDYKDSIDSDVEELEEYMNNYFENLDVQDEINNKLDEYLEDGTLEHIIASYLQTQKIYDTAEEMIADASNLVDGLNVQTLGYHSINDGGGAFYKITDTASLTEYQEDLGEGLYATLIEKELTPEMFGAYGDGTHDDHNALLELFKYVDTIKTIDGNQNESLTIKFNNKKYLNNSTITFGNDTTNIPSLNIDGNGAFILGYGFKFESTAGWKIHISNLNLKSMTTAFEFESRNLEFGNFIFDRLEFIGVENPFIMNRRSCIVEIKNCQFIGVSSIGEFTNVDRLYFHHNWVEPTSSIADTNYKSMLKQNTGDEGAMFIHDNLFVPVGGTNCNELCWIEVNEHARIYNNRFGGENFNYHPVRIGSGFLPKGGSNTKYPYLSFDHNDEVSGNTPLILESLAGSILIQENQGWISGSRILAWSDKLTEQQQDTLIDNQVNMLNLVIKNNLGRNTRRDGNGSDLSGTDANSIPTNLFGIVNRGLHTNIKNTGENLAYLKYLANADGTSQTLTIKKQPFKNISSASVGYNFSAVSNFALLVWCGFGYSSNYECKTTYMLITFEYITNTTNIKIHKVFLGEELAIDVAFSNGTDTIDATTLNGVSDLDIVLSTSTSGKTIKRVKAQIFRPHNQLSLFM